MKNTVQSSISHLDQKPRAATRASATSVWRIRAFIDAACGKPDRQLRDDARDARAGDEQDAAYRVLAFP
jgi:hypothetical protein